MGRGASQEVNDFVVGLVDELVLPVLEEAEGNLDGENLSIQQEVVPDT